ncbi:DENN domain-containing 3-like, partial [Brachionus plicatilis]
MTKKLHNSLIDYLVLVGCDKDTGLIFKDQFAGNENLDEILSIPIEPSILSVISCDLATYPSSHNQINTKYPPYKLTKDVSFDLGDSKEEINSRHVALKPVEVPIQADVLYNLAQFCFPNQAFVSKLKIDPFVHSFVLTDMEGKKKFSVALTYFREFYCSKNDETNMFELVEIFSEDEMKEKRNYFQIYVPTSIILMSQFSYFDVLKDCVSKIYNSISSISKSLNSIMERFAFQFTHLPVPPKSLTRFGLILEASFDDVFISLNPSDEFENQVFDLSLSLLFNRFAFDDILIVIFGFLSESKMLFISKNTSLLTPVLECFMKLIQPFKWFLSYVPLLPGSQLGYIEAPHPFIMGFCSDYENLKNQLEEDNDLMIIDIDEKKIYKNNDFVNFPQNFVDDLRKNFNLMDLNEIETKKLTSPTKFDNDLQKRFDKSIRDDYNSKIFDLFVEFYVEIFGDLTQFIKWQTKKFDKENYFNSVNESDLEFYKKVINTSIFEIFINSLIKNISEDKPDLYYQKQIAKSSDKRCLHKLEARSNSNVNFIRLITKTLVFKSPKTAIQDFTNELKNTNILFHKDSILYLRGLYFILINQHIDGFRDFFQIDSKNLFPKELIKENILPFLPISQIEKIKSQDYYISSEDFKKFDDDNENENNSAFGNSINSLDTFEDIEFLNDLKFDEFTQKLIFLEIRLDNEISRRLFDALTIGNSKLDFATFEIFIDTYQLKESELNKIKKFLPKNKIRTKEFALKISNHTLVPNYGIGNLVLTQKCLYLLELGTNKRKVITEIKDIISIEKTQYNNGLFNSKSALKINTLNEAVHISPDNEVNVWYLLFNELCSSFRIANETKDSSVVQLAAINVILMDSVLQSGLNSIANHSRDLDKSIKYLCFYTLYKSELSKLNMSKDAKKILHLKINPSIREYTYQSVESIISADIDGYPTVWCAV